MASTGDTLDQAMDAAGDMARTLGIGDFQSNAPRMSLTSPAMAEPMAVWRITGEEAISEPYRFDVEVVTDAAGMAHHALLDQPAVLSLDQPGASRQVAAVVAEATAEHAHGHFCVYRLRLVPALWRLSLRADCRLFQQQSIPEIIEATLRAAGLAPDRYRFDLQHGYNALASVAQYRETDLAFIQRLAAAAGLWFYFVTETPDASTGDDTSDGEPREIVVFTDANDNTPALGPLPFHADQGMPAHEPHLNALRHTATAWPDVVTLVDYDFTRPDFDLRATGRTASSTPHSPVERYREAGAGGVLDAATLQHRADVATQASEAAAALGGADSQAVALAPGHRFTLVGHPGTSHNRTHLVTAVTHTAEQPGVLEADAGDAQPYYRNRVTLLADEVPWRTIDAPARPMVRGTQSAVVAGPEGEVVHTDKHGRVRLAFQWDRRNAADETASPFIRVAHDWAGPGYGAFALPRIGQEVLIAFMDGDIDRPLVVGRVHHATQAPAYDLPEHKTKTVQKTDTVGGIGANELHFEDEAGREVMYWHAQKDQRLDTGHDKTQTTGATEALTVNRDRTVHVERDTEATIGQHRAHRTAKDHTVTIDGDRELTVMQNITLAVEGHTRLTVDRGQICDTAEHLYVDTATDIDIASDTGITLQSGSAQIEMRADGTVHVRGMRVSTTATNGLSLNAPRIDYREGGTSATPPQFRKLPNLIPMAMPEAKARAHSHPAITNLRWEKTRAYYGEAVAALFDYRDLRAGASGPITVYTDDGERLTADSQMTASLTAAIGAHAQAWQNGEDRAPEAVDMGLVPEESEDDGHT